VNKFYKNKSRMNAFYKWYTQKVKARYHITNEQFDRIVDRHY